MKTKFVVGFASAALLIVFFQNFSPVDWESQWVPAVEEIDSDDASAPAGDADAGLVTGLCPVRTADQMPLPLDEIRKGGSLPIVLAKGHYFHDGELHLTSPVKIQGQGRGKTKLTICIGPREAGIRIEAKNVSLSGFSIEVALKEKLLNGGSGEYGTGITVGRYLSRKALPAVSDIRIENIGISRGRLANGARSFTGNGLIVAGNVSKVFIRDIVLSNSHSIGLASHWGGLLPANCRYQHAYEIFTAAEKLRCPITRTYHPHDIQVSGVVTSALTNALMMFSSSYNIDVSNVTGAAPMALQILPGDEGIRYASAEDAKRVGSNIKVDQVLVHIRGENPGLPIMRIFSKGGSKWDGSYNDVFYRNVTIRNFEVTSSPEERKNFRLRKYSLVSKYGRGKNIKFENINFNDAGRGRGYSFGAMLSYSKGITLSGIKTQAKNGIAVKNSEDILIKNSQIRRSNVTATPTGRPPSHYSRGILIVDETRRGKEGPFPGYANSVSVIDNTISNYDVGVRISSRDFPGVSGICQRVHVDPANRVAAFLEPYEGEDCDWDVLK